MFKSYRQLEHSDCGLTCIRMVARYFGKKIPVGYLKSISDFNRLGMSIMDIRDCCARIGLQSAALRLDVSLLQKAPLPAILYWQQQHFVVLYKVDAKKGKFYIADPSGGKTIYSSEDFLRYWIPEGEEKGLVVLAEPDETFYEREYPRVRPWHDFLSYILNYVKEYKRYFSLVFLFTILIACADIALPLLLKKSVDDGIGDRNIHLVLIILLTQLAIAIGGLVSSGLMTLLMTRTGLEVYLRMASSFLTRLARLPLFFFDRRVSSDFVQKISDQSRIKDFLLSFPNDLLVMSLTLVVFSILLFHYSPLIFGIFVGMSVVEIFWDVCFLNSRKSIDYAHFTNSAENRNHAYELTNGMPDLKVNNAERARIARWNESQEAVNATGMKSARLDFYQKGGKSVISRFKELSVTGIGAMLVIGGDLTMGGLLTLGYITGRLALPFSNISTNMSSFQSALLSYQRIEEVMTEETDKRGELPFVSPTICFRNVWFKYAGSSAPFVIKDFSLEIKEGETVALVGESGCGKSTLIKLMLGFYPPSKGEILLSGVRVQDLDNSDWLRHCGVVMQEPRIFSASIAENVCLSEEKPSAEKAKEALEIAGLSAYIDSLPMGVNTRLGVSGIEMSGGQKQRLMIARALYKNPDILFLDEATSSLDANNERNIVNNIIGMNQGKTMVIAAHRLSTVQNADKILFIKEGRIVEQGTHDELIELHGEYWQLVRNQLQLSS